MARDKNGGIEGLPLQLMILVLIAGVGMAIILGWMGNLSPPSTIAVANASPSEITLSDADSDGIFTVDEVSLIISVQDQNGNPVPGASVLLSGSGVATEEGKAPHALTDGEGKASFHGLSVQHAGRSVGFVTVTVIKSGFASSGTVTIPVFSE